jgi:Zn-dependent protease
VPTSQGAIRLFRLAGIDVFLHWSWFVVAIYEFQRANAYHSPIWNVLEYLALFAIVTLHEFGHSLACRQVGGTANKVVLWPLGGVAYVDPPQRPGATLWSLVPVTFGLVLTARSMGLAGASPDAYACLRMVALINLGILVFNLLPVYPLDGGQILRSLLWYVLGRARSLTAATVVGFAGVLVLLVLALRPPTDAWLGILAAFVAMNCWRGFQHSRALARIAKLPRRPGYSCPSCRSAPLLGALWACGRCGASFDTFETGAVCPSCRATFGETRCADCGRSSPIGEWLKAGAWS